LPSSSSFLCRIDYRKCGASLTKTILRIIKMVKIVLVDDHELVRTGIRLILERVAGFVVVAEAKSGEDASDIVVKMHRISF
jgi:PleD family two-component response regulator